MNPFLSIKARLLTFALCISLIPITVITTIYYFHARSILRYRILEHVKAVAKSKENHALSLMEKMRIRTSDFGADGFLRDSLERIARGRTFNDNTVIRFNRYLSVSKLSLSHRFIAVTIVDRYGKVVSSTNERLVGKDISGQDVFVQGIGKSRGETYVGQPLYSSDLNAYCICISAPIISRRGTEKLGIIMNAYSLSTLNEVTKNRIGLGGSGEVYLVNRDKLMLTESRFAEDTLLKQIVDTEPVRKIAEHGEGMVGIYQDYRGMRVVGASVNISEYGWILLVEIDEAEALAPLKTLGIVALISVLVGAGAVTSLGIHFAISTSRPIRDLINATERLATGDLDYRVKVTLKDEIGALAKNFNFMAEKLQSEIIEHKRIEKMLKVLNDSLEQRVAERTVLLVKANKELTVEIEERKRAEDELREQRTQLESLTSQLITSNKELEAFCYSVSHDLRAPLRSINGFSKALMEDCSDRLDSQGKNYLHRVMAASKYMGQLIDDLLNLSRITRSEMNCKSFDMSALIETIATKLKELEPERQVEFVIAKGLIVDGDPHLMRIALENLLSNAWKFTGKRPRARVEFGVTEDNGKPVYFVRDNGAGFDMNFVNKLFGAFQRLHSITEFEGTGIGLATVQRIIHRHGGQVWAEGVVDQGATFHFTM